MNFKKVATSSVLALSLLVSAAPAFASTVAPNAVASSVTPKAIIKRDVVKTENLFANSFTENGITWYLKGITYSGGYYIGHYEANV
ncbi:LCI fold-containing protein [Paenibacillus chitinolyticus]|uniref:LCI fold-containing protein n=1 Tax=Paenibacillus chitinolyticus TaxID=79263 RepID=UPI00366C339A